MLTVGSFRPCPAGIAIVYMAVNRHVFIQSPTGRAVIDNNITHTVTSQSIIPEEHILRPPTETHYGRIIISCVSSRKEAPVTQTPSPGAVWPAIVIYGARTFIGIFSRITPETLNTTIRAPPVSHASRNVPGPLSASELDHNSLFLHVHREYRPLPLLPRERQVCCSLLNPPVWMPMVYKDVLEQPQTLLQVMLSPMPHPISGLFPFVVLLLWFLPNQELQDTVPPQATHMQSMLPLQIVSLVDSFGR